LDIRRKEILPENTGIRVKVRVVKNKVSAPFKAVMLDILFGTGIDSIGCTLDAAEELGVVDRKGSWYSYNGDNIAQGRLNVVELMKSDEKFALNIQTKVKEALSNFGKDPDEIVASAEEVVEEEDQEEVDAESEQAAKFE